MPTGTTLAEDLRVLAKADQLTTYLHIRGTDVAMFVPITAVGLLLGAEGNPVVIHLELDPDKLRRLLDATT